MFFFLSLRNQSGPTLRTNRSLRNSGIMHLPLYLSSLKITKMFSSHKSQANEPPPSLLEIVIQQSAQITLHLIKIPPEPVQKLIRPREESLTDELPTNIISQHWRYTDNFNWDNFIELDGRMKAVIFFSTLAVHTNYQHIYLVFLKNRWVLLITIRRFWTMFTVKSI